MKLETFPNQSPNATDIDAVGVRYHDQGTGITCYGPTEADAIDNLCKYVDRDQVNALLQKDDRFSTEVESAFTQAVGYAALATFGLLFALLLIP